MEDNENNLRWLKISDIYISSSMILFIIIFALTITMFMGIGDQAPHNAVQIILTTLIIGTIFEILIITTQIITYNKIKNNTPSKLWIQLNHTIDIIALIICVFVCIAIIGFFIIMPLIIIFIAIPILCIIGTIKNMKTLSKYYDTI